MTKKYFLVFFLLTVTAFYCRAQSFTLGVMGEAKNTWLVNTAVMGATTEQEVKPSFGFAGGFTACVYFQQQIDTYLGVGIDAIFGNHSQRYSGRVSGSPTLATYNSKVNLLFLDLPVYAKLVLRFGTYVEAGMQFSLLASAWYKSTGGLETSVNAKSKFSPFYYGPLVGLGADIPVSDDMYIFAGLRFVYGISDLKGVDGQGNDVSVPVNGAPDYSGKKTHAAYVALNLGVYYRLDIGKYGKVGRHRRQ